MEKDRTKILDRSNIAPRLKPVIVKRCIVCMVEGDNFFYSFGYLQNPHGRHPSKLSPKDKDE